MKVTDENLKMYLDPRALNLGDVLEILNALCCEFKKEYGYDVDKEALVNHFRNIKEIIPYLHLERYEFAKKMLSKVMQVDEKVDKILKEMFTCFDLWVAWDDDDIFEAEVPVIENLCLEAETNEKFNPRIFDFKKGEDLEAYANYNVIAYDFIDKMQQKLWDGILNDYLEIDLSNCDLSDVICIESLQKYDMDFIETIVFGPMKDGRFDNFLKENVVNWALVNGLIGATDDVNIIKVYKEEKVLIYFEVNI